MRAHVAIGTRKLNLSITFKASLSMLSVFLTVVLPTFLVACLGAGLQRWRKLAVGSLGPLTLYLLSPALMVESLMGAQITASDAGKIIFASVATVLCLIALGTLVSIVTRLPRAAQSAFLLSTAFPNAGNMGFPVAFLAFGREGLAVAAVVFAVQSVLGWTLGIYVAARSENTGLAPFLQVIKLPTIYAVVIALAFRMTDVQAPFAIQTAIELLASAAIPCMLIVLGFQIAQGISIDRWWALFTATALRLVGSALIAFVFTELSNLHGAAQQTVIVVAAMPTAVFTTLLASEFKAEPRFVTSAVVTSTVASMGTLTVLVTILQRHLA